jgi:hypothetical protein
MREEIIYLIDGNFTRPHGLTLEIDPAWSFGEFACYVSSQVNHEGCFLYALLTKWMSSGSVDPWDFQIFLLPRNPLATIRLAFNILCEQGWTGHRLLASVLPEVTWEGHLSIMPLSAVFPPEGTYEILIVPERNGRHTWGLVEKDDLSLGDATAPQCEIYRSVAPLTTTQRRSAPLSFLRVPTQVFYGEVCESLLTQQLS